MISPPLKKTLNKPKKTRKRSIKQKPHIHIDDWENKYCPYRGKKTPETSIRAIAGNVVRIAAEDPDVLTFNSVLARCRIDRKSYSLYARNHPILVKAKEFAYFRIGINREEAALRKQIDIPTMKHMQGTYDPQWKEQEQYFNDLKKDIVATEAERATFVLMDSFKGKVKKQEKDNIEK